MPVTTLEKLNRQFNHNNKIVTMANVINKPHTAKQMQLTVTVKVNDCNLHPLIAHVNLLARWEPDNFDSCYGWTWEVKELIYVELLVGDKEGIDITDKIKSNPRAKAIIIADVADCDSEIYKQLKETRRVA